MSTFNCDCVTIFQFVKKYGNLFCLDLSGKFIIIVSGLPLIKEVLVHMDQNFMNRPIPPIRERSFKKNGKILTNVRWVLDILMVC